MKKNYPKMSARADAVAIPFRRKGMTDEEFEHELRKMATKIAHRFEELANQGYSTQVQEIPGKGYLVRGVRVEEASSDFTVVSQPMDLLSFLQSIPTPPNRKEAQLIDTILEEVLRAFNHVPPTEKAVAQRVVEDTVGRFTRAVPAHELQSAISLLEKESGQHSQECAVPTCIHHLLLPVVIDALKKQSVTNVH